MKRLLLILAVCFPLAASAQNWTFDRNIDIAPFLGTGSENTTGLHGVGVDDTGRLWVQPHFATESIQRNGADTGVRALYVLETDGTQAPCSPILYIKDGQGAVIDTLGVYTTASGASDTRTGRGLTVDSDGNILVSQFDILYEFDASSCTAENPNSIVQLARAQPSPGNSITEAAHDDEGNVYVAAVVGAGRPLFQYGPDLSPAQNVAANAYDISRDMLATPSGLAVIDHAFTKPGAVVHARPDLFTPFDSIGVTLRGLSTEASGVNSTTGRLWFSSGPAGSFDVNQDPVVMTSYQTQAWYAYEESDLFVTDANGVITGTIENPSPRDSIVVGADWTTVGPRGIAFSNDGDTAYVVNFGEAVPVGLKVFIRTTNNTSTETAEALPFELAQNQPNPFSGQTTIGFALDAPGYVRLRVMDMTGRTVAVLAEGPRAAGPHAATFDASGLAVGVYAYALEVDGARTSRQMLVVR